MSHQPIAGIHHVTAIARDPQANANFYSVTAGVLTETLGFRLAGEEGDRLRFETAAGGAGSTVDLLAAPSAPRGVGAAGTVHHVAFRAADDADQEAWLSHLAAAGLPPLSLPAAPVPAGGAA